MKMKLWDRNVININTRSVLIWIVAIILNENLCIKCIFWQKEPDMIDSGELVVSTLFFGEFSLLLS